MEKIIVKLGDDSSLQTKTMIPIAFALCLLMVGCTSPPSGHAPTLKQMPIVQAYRGPQRLVDEVAILASRREFPIFFSEVDGQYQSSSYSGGVFPDAIEVLPGTHSFRVIHKGNNTASAFVHLTAQVEAGKVYWIKNRWVVDLLEAANKFKSKDPATVELGKSELAALGSPKFIPILVVASPDDYQYVADKRTLIELKTNSDKP